MTANEAATRVRTRTDPSIAVATELLTDGIESGGLVTVVGRCTVDYDGRAASHLEIGDRHVMCKPDGAVLVHTDEGQKPINWQPPGCDHEVRREDRALVLDSRRSTPDEQLLVRFEDVFQVSTFAMTDSSELTLVGTEADLKDRILETPDELEAGFQPLATERETPAGAVDIYGRDEAGRTVVVELKRRRVGPDAVSQLRRYVDALAAETHTETEIRGILVAPSLTDRAHRLLEGHGLEFVSLEP